MSDFKWRHFEGEIILWAVRWYCRYGISYRDLEQMMGERGVCVDHSTIYRWVQKYAPKMEKRLRWCWRRPQSTSWCVDETYIKVRGRWTYLYRAVDKFGNTIDFYLSPTRNAKAAKRFLGKALMGLKDWEKPTVINTDKASTYAVALAELKEAGKCPQATEHRQVKYLNNVVEADHGKLKQLPPSKDRNIVSFWFTKRTQTLIPLIQIPKSSLAKHHTLQPSCHRWIESQIHTKGPGF
jgi:transposase, IS6 family